MYWFGELTRRAVEEWVELGTTILEQGRRPELAWTRTILRTRLLAITPGQWDWFD